VTPRAIVAAWCCFLKTGTPDVAPARADAGTHRGDALPLKTSMHIRDGGLLPFAHGQQLLISSRPEAAATHWAVDIFKCSDFGATVVI